MKIKDKYKDYRIKNIQDGDDFQYGGGLDLMFISFEKNVKILNDNWDYLTLEMLEKQLKELMKILNDIGERLDSGETKCDCLNCQKEEERKREEKRKRDKDNPFFW